LHHGPDLGRGAGLHALSSRDDLIVPDWDVRRLTAALICTSDVHTVKGALPVPDGRTLGHESVGVIHQLGSAVTGKDDGIIKPLITFG
jgi:threonine dehydrogenase-like Zn-dependent dehydrogenase